MGVDVDKGLQKELRTALRRPRNFVFSPGAKLENHFLQLSKKKIPKVQIQAAKLESGSSKVYWGACFPEGTTVVFETTKQVPETLSKKLRVTARKKGGLASIDVLIRQNVDLVESDFEDEEEKQDAPSTAPTSEEDFVSQARAVVAVRMKTIDKGLAWIKSAKPKGAKQIVATLQGAQSALVSAKTAEECDAAIQKHDDVIALLRAAMKAAGAEKKPKTAPAKQAAKSPIDGRITAAKRLLTRYAKLSYADPQKVRQLTGLLKLVQSLQTKGDSDKAEQALTQLDERMAKAKTEDHLAQLAQRAEYLKHPKHKELKPKFQGISALRTGVTVLVAQRAAVLKASEVMFEHERKKEYAEAVACLPEFEKEILEFDRMYADVVKAKKAFEKKFQPHRAEVGAAMGLTRKGGLPPQLQAPAKALRKPGTAFEKAVYEGRYEDAGKLLADVAQKAKALMDEERKLAKERKEFQAAEKKTLGKSFKPIRDFAETMSQFKLDRGELKAPVGAVLAARKAIDAKLKVFDYVGATQLLGPVGAAMKKLEPAKAAYDKARKDAVAASVGLKPRVKEANNMPGGVGTSSADKLAMNKWASDFNDLYTKFDYVACVRLIVPFTKAIEKVEAAQAKLAKEEAAFEKVWDPVSGDYFAVKNLYKRTKKVTKQVDAFNAAWQAVLTPFQAYDYPTATAAIPALVTAMKPLLKEFPKQQREWNRALKSAQGTKKKWFAVPAVTPALKTLDAETQALWDAALKLAKDNDFKGAKAKLGEFAVKARQFLAAAAAHDKAAQKKAKQAEKGVSKLVKGGKLKGKSVNDKKKLLEDLQGVIKMSKAQRKAQRAIYDSMDMDADFLAEDKKKRTAIVDELTDTKAKKKKLKDFLKNWDKKPKGERLDVVRDAIAAQCKAMGLDPPPEVVEINKGWENNLIENGYFDPNDGKIYINTHPDSSFNTGMESALDLAFHENSHNYQDELVKRLDPTHPDALDPTDPEYDQAVMFAMNSGRNAYVEGEEDFATYKKQPLEDHAHDNGPKTAKALLKKLR